MFLQRGFLRYRSSSFTRIEKCVFTYNCYSVIDKHCNTFALQTVDSNKLSKIYLKRLVTARDRPLNQPFVTIKQLEEYADQVFSSLFHLLVELNGIKDIQVDHVVSHLGKAQGIVTLLRAIPYKGRSQALNIPQEVLVKHGVSQERIVRNKVDDKGVEECIFEVASVAHQHLEKVNFDLHNYINENYCNFCQTQFYIPFHRLVVLWIRYPKMCVNFSCLRSQWIDIWNVYENRILGQLMTLFSFSLANNIFFHICLLID